MSHTLWDHKIVRNVTEAELRELGQCGWRMVSVTEISNVSVYDEDVPPTMESPGVLLDVETRVSGVMVKELT